MHETLQPQISPSRLRLPLRRALNPERRVLVRHYVVLFVRVERLILRRDDDVFGGEFGGRRGGKGFEEVGVMGGVQVDVIEGGVAGLGLGFVSVLVAGESLMGAILTYHVQLQGPTGEVKW